MTFFHYTTKNIRVICTHIENPKNKGTWTIKQNKVTNNLEFFLESVKKYSLKCYEEMTAFEDAHDFI